MAQNSGSGWFSAWVQVFSLGLFCVCSYWAAVTLGWATVRVWIRAPEEQRGSLKGITLVCSLFALVPAGLVFLLGGWPFFGLGAVLWLAPIAGYTPVLLRPRKQTPMYARAIARMKFGKYSDAEMEIIQQLEK